MKEPWIERDANGRPTGITGVAGRNALFDAAEFLDAPNGGKANLPMDVIMREPEGHAAGSERNRASRRQAAQCLWDDLYRQFQRRERPACGSSASAHGARRAAAAPARMRSRSPQLPTLRTTTATSGWTTRTTASDSPAAAAATYRTSPEPIAAQEVWDAWGRFALAVAKAGIPVQLHTVTEIAIGEQLDAA